MSSYDASSCQGGKTPPSVSIVRQIVVIGASTGGTDALKTVLSNLPANTPPVMVVQHMPENFTETFASRLNDSCQMRVKEAEHDESLCPGTVYIAPGHSHLLLARGAGHYRCCLSSAEPCNRHRPSVDMLFRSVVAEASCAIVAVLLTGMGRDGADGLLKLRQKGAWTITQDQASCVVYGMPRVADQIGASCESLPIEEVAQGIVRRLPGLSAGNPV
ncbi:MAG: chemotaxis protein CheB [Rhodocyclaceae bacterium]|nr:chemotaxis protein CheB [Rhodocyclaceae bacterium]MBR4738275.1 chemotaxis protein CheB [Rhodocyclaceae bacterium]MBR4878143.1 chemotaxis protein CheB [Rhodocyclaceae bacterium]